MRTTVTTIFDSLIQELSRGNCQRASSSGVDTFRGDNTLRVCEQHALTQYVESTKYKVTMVRIECSVWISWE